jgi:hypothetical protein
LKHITIIDEYLESHKLDLDLEYEVFFTPLESPFHLVSYPQQEDLNVPNKQEKATIWCKLHAILELHENITHELLNPIPF